MRPRQRRRTRHSGRAQSGGGGTRLLLPVWPLQQQGVEPGLWDLQWKPQRAQPACLHCCVMPDQLPSFAEPIMAILCQTAMGRQVRVSEDFSSAVLIV